MDCNAAQPCDVIHMKNGLLEATIEQHRNKTLNVYKADPERIVRDARAAERATGDHAGRWLFELLQNSDDAGATEVLVLVKDDTVYVADNGNGLKSAAVSAICGTDFSDKTTGTIGRKGVGFKSVYEVSRNPQVLTVDGHGIEFSPEKTKAWLHDNDLNKDYVPHQWVPFFISWADAQEQDPHLETFKAKGFKTIVRLPGLSPEKKTEVEQLLKEWPPHALFAFRHLRKIKAPALEVVLSAGDGVWFLRDSRGQTPIEWLVVRQMEFPPGDLLEVLRDDERKAVSKDGVSFLIAAPLKDNCVVATLDYLPVHVFYPTEQIGPVRLLLHAEFLVKSDRTALIPVDSNPFNEWVADKLVDHICKFVNDSYRPKAPSSNAALLVPFRDRASHPVANTLWQRIAKKAQADLRLADVEALQRLTLGEARLISVSVRHDLARKLLEATSVRGQLLHCSFDQDKDARNTLKELNCKEIRDQELMEVIAENALSLAANPEWVWACWEWLAAWVAREPYGSEHKTRVERAATLPIVPINRILLKPSDLEGRIVTWKLDAGAGDQPDWLPLTFVEDWFRDRIQNEAEQRYSVNAFIKELGIEEPDRDVIQRAVGLAIEQYWKDKQGDPGRFLRFILEQDWHETALASPALRRCPVPTRGGTWVEAEKAYFGGEWENDVLDNLYAGIGTVAWVAFLNRGNDKEKQRLVLEWLGVAYCPKIVEECYQEGYVWQLPEDCVRWKQYLKTARDDCGRCVERIDRVSRMEHLTLEVLDSKQAQLLVCLIAKHWATYYRDYAKISARGTIGKEQYYRSWQVNAKWWWEVLEILRVSRRDGSEKHIPLAALWLPEKRTEQAIGDLLPVIDLDAFVNDKEVVRDWLVSVVGLRTQMEQLTVEEWKKLLSTCISGKAPAEYLMSDERLRDKVTKWYEACLETVKKQENIAQDIFASCPLLCVKHGSWQYVNAEPRYLNDDNDLATAFADDVWLFHVRMLLAIDAAKYLGVLPLSQHVRVEVTLGEPKSQLSHELLARLNDSLPYLWAWRSSQSKQDPERLFGRLKGLNVHVVPDLKAKLELACVHREAERRWHVDGDTIYLHKDHANETELALALAKLVDVRSEADFYENLLRCNDGHQRNEKLLSKGMANAELERCLREYSRQLDKVEDERDKSATKVPGIATPESKVGRDDQIMPSEQRQSQSGASPKTQAETEERQPLRLKNPHTAEYVFGNPPGGGVRTGSGGGGYEQEKHPVTDAEKEELEETGRILVARELEKRGYSVEKMPKGNPGFDLRAKKNGDELRVEVKAHSGRATVVDVTQREYKEYLGQQGYRWELWNVEHLAQNDESPVVVTWYDTIPDEALDVRTFRVDLKKCQLIS